MDAQKQAIIKATALRIRSLRREKGISQEELALRSGINPAYLGQLERGLKCPTVDTLYKISLGLEVPLPELLRFNVSVGFSGMRAKEIERLITQIPSHQQDQVVKILENIVSLVQDSTHDV